MKTLLLLAGLLLAACSSTPVPTSKQQLEQLFGQELSRKHPVLGTGKHVVFIVNKIDCSPCIATIQEVMGAPYPATKKAILFERQLVQVPAEVELWEEEPRTVAQYGLLTPKGIVCLFRNGKLTQAVSLDTERPDILIRSIQTALK